jgi:four helix bundle protein
MSNPQFGSLAPALAPALARSDSNAIFDHDRLEVYQNALSFLAIADDIIESLPRGRAYLADQLHRAALSVVANTAEGAGEFAPRDKARFYRMALRSGTESAALLDACRILTASDSEILCRARMQLYAVVRMLGRMSQNLRARASGKGKGRGKGEPIMPGPSQYK